MLERAGVAARLHREGLIHRGVTLAIDGDLLEIDFDASASRRNVTIYGQTEIMKDLIDAAVARGATAGVRGDRRSPFTTSKAISLSLPM